MKNVFHYSHSGSLHGLSFHVLENLIFFSSVDCLIDSRFWFRFRSYSLSWKPVSERLCEMSSSLRTLLFIFPFLKICSMQQFTLNFSHFRSSFWAINIESSNHTISHQTFNKIFSVSCVYVTDSFDYMMNLCNVANLINCCNT